MALRDIFKKKKRKEKPAKPVKKPKEIKEEKPQEAISETKTRKVKKEVKIGEAYRVLKSPHVTEKAADLAKKNQYVFKVFPEVNKIRVKKAIEDLYGVDVMSVKIVNVPSKKRRLGRVSGYRSGYKKAIIKIKEGQKIEIMPR